MNISSVVEYHTYFTRDDFFIVVPTPLSFSENADHKHLSVYGQKFLKENDYTNNNDILRFWNANREIQL